MSLKISKSIGVLYKLRKYVPQDVLKTIYYSIIYPHITYGILSWGSACPTTIKPLQGKQNRALKLIFNIPWRQQTRPMYFNLKFLKINELYHQSILQLIHKFHNKHLPPAFESHFKPLNEINPYQTRRQFNQNYVLPTARKNYGLRSPTYEGIKLWSQVDLIAKSLSINQFKTYSFNNMLSRYQ